MQCLYASDYGPPDPAFDPFVDNGRLLKGFEGHVYQLATARNLAQLKAMERQIQRGEEVAWCDQGYGWVYQPPLNDFFIVVLIALVFPYLVLRLWPRVHNAVRRAWPTRRARMSERGIAVLASAPLDRSGDER